MVILAALVIKGDVYESNTIDRGGVSLGSGDNSCMVALVDDSSPPICGIELPKWCARAYPSVLLAEYDGGEFLAAGTESAGLGGDSKLYQYQAPSFSPQACWPFPAEECATLWRVGECESGNGSNPRTYDIYAENGGLYQINRSTWADYFERAYGWPWRSVVEDDDLNRVAAYIIWQRSGWSAWACW